MVVICVETSAAAYEDSQNHKGPCPMSALCRIPGYTELYMTQAATGCVLLAIVVFSDPIDLPIHEGRKQSRSQKDPYELTISLVIQHTDHNIIAMLRTCHELKTRSNSTICSFSFTLTWPNECLIVCIYFQHLPPFAQQFTAQPWPPGPPRPPRLLAGCRARGRRA